MKKRKKEINISIKRVLIIQEDAIMLKILEYLFLSLDFQVKAVESFTEIELEDQHVFYDVVITDILFEAISPTEFIINLQESINTDNIIVVSNMGQEKVRKNIFALPGVKGFYGIPFDMDLLQQQIEDL